MGEERTTEQARIELEQLVAQIEKVIWFDDYVELRFQEGFDASVIYGRDGSRSFCRIGSASCRETFRRLEWLGCRLYAATGRELHYRGQGNYPRLREWIQLYLSLGKGRPEGKNWIRFHIEPGCTRFELEGSPVRNREGDGVKFVIGFDRP